MKYKIVVDSCCELPEELKKDDRFEIVSLEIEVGNHRLVDDETFDQADFLKKVAAASDCPKSSCPSPDSYMESYRTEAEHVYVVTLSSKLSGSYNSAVLGIDLYHETYGEKSIYVVDSWSASGGELQLALKAMELEEMGTYSFEEIVRQLDDYRNNMNTYFVLDNLDTLRKNGRLTGVKALVATTLSIKPVMGAKEGVIVQHSQAVGIKKGLKKMAELSISKVVNPEQRRLIITHCNNLGRAELVRDFILSKVSFKETIILDTAGISSLYANDGGVILTM
ncbi:MAG: DegV family protein [Eubacteriales bacterium]